MARILVVDDVRFIATMIAQLFEGAGHDVSIAQDGEEALAQARELLPDLILLDLVMPGMDGMETARRLKSDPLTHPIPIMMVSAKGDLNTVSEAFAADIAEFVSKPFETAELMEKAAMLLGDFRMTYSISEDQKIPTVSVLHDELAVETFDLLLGALRTAGGDAPRPIVLDLSRVRRLAPETEREIDAFAGKIRDLGENLQVVRPEAGTRASQILPGVVEKVKLHDSRREAVSAARKAARLQGMISRASSLLAASPQAAPAGAVRFEMVDTVALVRISGRRVTDAELESIGRDHPRGATVILIELSAVEAVSRPEVQALGELIDAVALSGRLAKLVNPSAPVAAVLREGGLGAHLVTLKVGPQRRGASTSR
jgi:CheY-like chemotaxis protein